MSHELCAAWLVARRRVARDHGDPTDQGLGVLDNADRGLHRYFVVESSEGKIVWEGGACCRFEARAYAIDALAKTEKQS